MKKQTFEEQLYGGFDFQKTLTKTFPDTEFHLPGYSFCGPGTNLKKRLKNFNPETGEDEGFITEPINKLDKGCYKHDIAYTKTDNLEDRHLADKDLIRVANEVINSKRTTFMEKMEARLTKALLNAKVSFGLGFDCHCKHNTDCHLCECEEECEEEF